MLKPLTPLVTSPVKVFATAIGSPTKALLDPKINLSPEVHSWGQARQCYAQQTLSSIGGQKSIVKTLWKFPFKRLKMSAMLLLLLLCTYTAIEKLMT